MNKKWKKKGPLRLAGYLSPLWVALLTIAWFRPHNQIGWVQTWFFISVTGGMFFAFALVSARSEARSRLTEKLEGSLVNDGTFLERLGKDNQDLVSQDKELFIHIGSKSVDHGRITDMFGDDCWLASI